MTMAATLASTDVADAICGAEPGVFMHGPTFMANPLASAAAVASIDLLLAGDWHSTVAAIERQLADELAPARDIAGVVDVRVKGAIGVIEMVRPVDTARATATLLDEGVWLRPFGRLIYTMPPYIVETDQLTRITGAMKRLAGL